MGRQPDELHRKCTVRTSPFNKLVPCDPPTPWPVVLLFHTAYPVLNRGDVFHRWNTTVDRIKCLINHLEKHFRFLDEAAFLELQENNWKNAEGRILVTFDDGYAMLYDHLFEFFHRKSIRPLLFLLTGPLGQDIIPWYSQVTALFRQSTNTIFKYDNSSFDIERLPERLDLYRRIQRDVQMLPNKMFKEKIADLFAQSDNLDESDVTLSEDMKPLTRWQIQKLSDAGWGIGSHGVSHYPATTLNPQQLEWELAQSKKDIEAFLGKPVRTLSYSQGSHNATVRRIAKKYYRAAFVATTAGRLTSPYQIPRIPSPDLEHELFSLTRIPKARLRLVRAYHKPHNAVVQQMTRGWRTLWAVLPLLVDSTERPLLLNLIARRLRTRRSKPARQRPVSVDPIALGTFGDNHNSTAPPSTAGSKRVVVLCGPHPPQRKAVAELARHCNIVGVIIHNRGNREVNIITSTRQNSPFSASRTVAPYVAPYFWAENASQLRLLGPDSFAWFLASQTKTYSTTDINHPAVMQIVWRLRPDIVLCFGTGFITGELPSLRIPTFNLHLGLSPWFRGPHADRWPVYLDCPDMIGVTLHELSSHVHGGNIVAQERPVLDGSETATEIEYKLTLVGIALLKRLVQMVERNRDPVQEPQNLSKGKLYTKHDFTDRISRAVDHKLEDGFIWRHPLNENQAVRLVQLRARTPS